MKDTKCNYTLNLVCRWFVGLVFIFSGFVKGVDPIGTAYKIEEYFSVWSGGWFDFQFLVPCATVFAMILITCEFLVGVMLLTNSFRRFTAWLLVAMMLFFTFSTALDAYSKLFAINDCGCFGDAVKLTPKQTFFKNVILDIPVIIIVLTRNIRRKSRFERDTIILLLTVIAMVCFGLYNINNEPVIDFRAWKVGNKMMSTDENLKIENYTTYRNLATGVEREFSDAELAAACKDSTFSQTWDWVSTRTIDPHEIQADGFAMMDADGNDYAVDLLMSPDPLMIMTIHHLDKVDVAGVEAMRHVMKYAEDNGIYAVMLTSALPENADQFKADNGFELLDVYFTDDKAIEAMLRSNPGFILMQDAVVMGKWHYKNVDSDILEY